MICFVIDGSDSLQTHADLADSCSRYHIRCYRSQCENKVAAPAAVRYAAKAYAFSMMGHYRPPT